MVWGQLSQFWRAPCKGNTDWRVGVLYRSELSAEVQQRSLLCSRKGPLLWVLAGFERCVGPLHSRRQMLGLGSAIHSHHNENSWGRRPTHTHARAHAWTHSSLCLPCFQKILKKPIAPAQIEKQTVRSWSGKVSQRWIHDLIIMCWLEKRKKNEWPSNTHTQASMLIYSVSKWQDIQIEGRKSKGGGGGVSGRLRGGALHVRGHPIIGFCTTSEYVLQYSVQACEKRQFFCTLVQLFLFTWMYISIYVCEQYGCLLLLLRVWFFSECYWPWSTTILMKQTKATLTAELK